MLAIAEIILGGSEDAEDILVETLATAWRKGRSLRDSGAIRPWLLRIATNHSLSWKRRARSYLRPRIREITSAEDHSQQVVDRLAVRALVDRLPPRTRAAVVLHYYADLTVDQVAAALDRSPETVKAQLRAALKRLRDDVHAVAQGDSAP